jgi:hypothetical protein
MTLEQIDLITGALGCVFTLLIFSYLLGDNPLFRIAAHIFVGVAAGYIALVSLVQVTRLLSPLFSRSAGSLHLVVPLLLIGLLLLKVSPRTTHLGAPAMAYLVGVGTAVAIGGAAIGTFTPQAFATIEAFDVRPGSDFLTLLNGLVILAGVVTTLAYFHFSGRASDNGPAHRFAAIEWTAWIGRIFIAITLGVLFAGVYIAALAALIDRVASIQDFILQFFPR